MRTLIAWTLTLALGTWVAEVASAQTTNPPTTKARQTAPAAGKAAPARPAPLDPAAVKARQVADQKALEEMNALLAAWEKQSEKITSLSVGFLKVERSPGFGDEYFDGVAQLKSPDRACMELRKFKLNEEGKPLQELEKNPSQRIVCDGQQVLQYEWDQRAIYIYPLDKEIRQKALQEGPLPFLFNMKAAEVKKRYNMTLLETTPEIYKISIFPNLAVDKESFSRAVLFLNKTTFLPKQLVLFTTPDLQGDRTHYTFKAIHPNQTIPDELFKPVTTLEGWKVIRDPGGQGQQQAVKPAQGQPAGAQPKRTATTPVPNRPAK